MSIREHLSELKKRFKIVFISFVALLVVFLIVPVAPFSPSSYNYSGFTPVIAFFISRMKLDLLPPHWELIAIHLNEPLEIYIVASVLLALIFNSPIFAYEVVRFIGPALNERERKIIYPFVGATSGLFAFGALFGYIFLAKFLLVALAPFFNIIGAGDPIIIDASDFYFVMLLTIGMSGIAFTVPVYIYTLIRFGVVQASTFRKNRLIIWAGTYILTAIITPDGGPLLDIILFLPIITLLELAVFLGGRYRSKEMKARDAAAATTALATTTSTTQITVGATPEPPSTAPETVPAPTAGSVRVCAYCRGELTPGSVFCPSCGRANE
jgi:sec-independent protein translocase protein TatC